MAKLRVPENYKTVIKLFESLSGKRSLWAAYQDVIEMIALTLQNSVEMYPARYKKQEQRYLDIAKQYQKKELETVTKIFAELTLMLEDNPYQDLLGDLYMRLNMGSDALGQFFTPYSISKMMALMTLDIDSVKSRINEKGYITINEPCVGGGANIIGYLDVLKSNDINYQKNCIVVGQDLSRIAALMAYVVLSLIGCQAVIKIGDTLSVPYINFAAEVNKNDIWYTPMFVINGGYMRGV